MKFKNILSAILFSAALFAGCAKDEATDSLKSIQVSQTYLSIAPAGSTVSVDVTSSVAWSLKSDQDWLGVSATSGGAGQTRISFSAPACEYGREAVVQIAAGVHTQFITVRQGEMTVETVTCKEAMEGTEGKTFRVTGAVTSIVNTQFGNMYLDDGSGKECYIYGTLDEDGNEQNFSSLGIELGDVLTVEGPLTYYGGTTPELVNVTVIKIEKSLLKLDKTSATVPAAGGEFVVKAAYKGNGAFASFDDDAQGWLSLKSMERVAGVPTKLEKAPADTAVITFSVVPNTASSRSSVVTISSSNSAGKSTQTVAVTQRGLSGTLEIPFTVDEAIAFCKGLTDRQPTEDIYYIKGKVSQLVSGGFSAQYGNGTFWISTDGVFNDDKSKDFEVYRAMYLKNEKFVEGDRQIQVGDEVVICGQLTRYGSTCETNQNKAYVVSINGVKDKMTGDGTVDNPFNVAAAICFCNTLTGATTEDYYVEGVISQLVSGGYSTQYGNGTFWISNDGVYNGDLTKDFEVYRALYLDNKSFVEGDANVAVGGKVVICGQLTNYKGTSETNQNKAYLYSYTPANN